MGKKDPIKIIDVISVLGLHPRPGLPVDANSPSVNFECPFCKPDPNGRVEYVLNVNFQTDTFRCPKCHTHGGACDLYAQYRFQKLFPRRTEEGRNMMRQFRAEMNGKVVPTAPRPSPGPDTPAPPIIRPADDSKRNRVYQRILKLDILKLSDTHKASLIARGLSEADINKGEYRTIPVSPGELWENRHDLDRDIANLPIRVPRSMVLLGLKIVNDIQSNTQFDFTGIPGFYKVGSRWAFYVTPGILIPTRNHLRQITCFQVRKSGKVKYMTLNQKCLPFAVQEDISRAHFVHNSRPNSKEKGVVMLTEGPLKADVIAALSDRPVAVLAIPGISTTKCLIPELKWLKSQGVKEIYNCFDMDKLTNKNVRNGSLALKRLLQVNGFTVRAMVWDLESARQEQREMFRWVKWYNIHCGLPIPEKTGNPFTYLARLCEALESDPLIPPHHEKPNYWPSRSKGFDDWLLYLRDHPPAH